VRGRTGPFDPYVVTKEYAELCKQYRITSVTGDAYSKEWVPAAWRNCGITYNVSKPPASDLYLEAEALFNRGLVELPDEPILIRELRLLERHPGNSGKDSVSHPRNA
jgi:hypothetical protein